MSRPLGVGDVIKVALPESTPTGKEQEGTRPAIVVGLPSTLGPLRFPMLLIVPMTSEKPHYQWAKDNPGAYPLYTKGTGGLTRDTLALIDQVRTLDATRALGRLGTLSAAELEPIKQGLSAMVSQILK